MLRILLTNGRVLGEDPLVRILRLQMCEFSDGEDLIIAWTNFHTPIYIPRREIVRISGGAALGRREEEVTR